jgi:hypothetical protein
LGVCRATIRPAMKFHSIPSRGDAMRGVLNIIIGLVFVIGGLSGKLVMKGTQSGGALAVIGVVLLGLGAYRMVSRS